MKPFVLLVEDQEPLLEAMQVAVKSFYDGRVMAAEGGSGAINGMAEIVGIADEFVNLMTRAKTDRTIDPIRELEAKVINGFSANVVQALKEGLGFK